MTANSLTQNYPDVPIGNHVKFESAVPSKDSSVGNAPSGWSERVIRDLAPKGGLVGGPFGSSLGTKDYVGLGVPVIRGQNLGSDGRFDGSEFVYVSEGKADELKRNIAIPGDLVFTQRGTLGQVGIVPAGHFERYVISQSQMRLRPDPEVADFDFLYYVFRSPQMLDMIGSRAIVTGVPHINLGILGDFHVLLPPLPVQRAIADVLGALDDKIESNRRIQNLLEFESQVLYERYYEYDSESSSCREVKLAELADINPPRQLKKGSIAKYVEMSSLPTMNALIEHWEEREVGSGQKFLNGDTLVARITPCLENGKGAFVDFLDENEVAWGSTEYIVLRPHEPLPSPWAYCLSRTTRFRDFAIRHMNGSSGRQRCDASALREYLVRVAPEGLTNEFTKSVTKNFERMGLARDENHALEKLRDALLPELLSGRLRVKDAESMMENV